MIAAGLVTWFVSWMLARLFGTPPALLLLGKSDSNADTFFGLGILIGYSLMIAGAAKWLWMVAP